MPRCGFALEARPYRSRTQRRFNSQNGNLLKINPEKWHVFRGRINVVFSPSFTSIPPQIHHQKTTIYTTFSQKSQQVKPLHTGSRLSAPGGWSCRWAFHSIVSQQFDAAHNY
jgi:hypothetical protein